MRLVAALGEVTAEQWEFVTLTIAQRTIGVENPGLAQELARLYRESMTADALLVFREATRRIDVTELLPSISVPTLVLRRSDDSPLQFSQEIASMIPEAQLQVRTTSPVLSDAEADAIAAFLGVSDAASTGVGSPPTSPAGTTSVQTILFTDLVSSTALTQRLGDAKAQELVRAHNAIVREALSASGGAEIKHTGDGIMASFPTASGALECAVVIQRALAERADDDLGVHIGLNAGEPVAEESDLFGTSVQLARRICDHAEAGKILASNVVRELSAGKGFLFADIGEVVPKGFEEPVRLYEVRWREEAEP
jgi:class 3 adenylate cyclase